MARGREVGRWENSTKIRAHITQERHPGYYDPPSRVLQRESAERRQVEQCRSRLILVMLVLGISYGMLTVKLCEVALVKPESQNIVVSGEEGKRTVAPHPFKRSSIVDRNGVLLAGSLATRSLYANAKLIERFGVEETAKGLHAALPDIDYATLLAKLKSGKTFIYIKRHLTPAEQEKVNDLGIPGLEFEESQRRVYPLGRLFSHVLGFVDVDGRGISGMERYFDKELTSSESSLQLSIDARLQHIMHEELSKGIEEFQAIGGVGMVMDMKNGELLSMVSLPDFDPNQLRTATPEARFNRATLGVYEMGSTFKTFTMAMALNYGTATLQDSYDATHAIRYGGFTISDSHPENRWMTVPEIYVHSSNIGTAKMIMDVGIERQKAFLGKLGLFDKMSIELPEVARPLIPNPWHEINMLTVSYGHGISVTPLHLVRAVASLLGDGHLMQPTLLKQNDVLKEKPEAIVKPEVVKQIRKLMRLVVQYGTGKQADVPGYRVGGKTGTAEKVKSGGYAANDKLASFIGMFPSEAPRYLVLAMLDEPRGNKKTYGFATGGWVAAPVASRVISRMAPLYGIAPIYELPEEIVSPEEEKRRQQGFIHAISY